MDCIFCKIVSGEIPSLKVYEDSEVICFLDINPLSVGHCLVVPKKHCENITSLEGDVMVGLKKVSNALLKFNSGLNVLQNNGSSAGQMVDHVHFHLIPRNDGDGVNLGSWNANKFSKDDLEMIQDKIINLLKEG